MRSRGRGGDERPSAALHVLDGTMRPCAAVVVFLWSAAPLLLLEASTCQMTRHHGQVEGKCPVRLTSAVGNNRWGFYTVTLHVRMTTDDLCNYPEITILDKTLSPTVKRRNCVDKSRRYVANRVKCNGNIRSDPSGLWELKDEVDGVKAGKMVFVSYRMNSTSCTVNHTVPAPVPDFEMSVNRLNKTINVTVESEKDVHIRWCHSNRNICLSGPAPSTVVPLQSQSVLLSVPYLLPCVCVQAYYTYRGAKRREKCPFKDDKTVDVGDVWQTSKFTVFLKKLIWSVPCQASLLNVSGSLCWSQHQHCIPLSNSTLEMSRGPPLEFNIGAVDRHPQICMQFSLQNSHPIYCPFKSDTPTWQATIGPGRRSFVVYLSSSEPATFSARLCVLSKTGCVPAGTTQSVKTQRNTTKAEIDVPVHTLTEQLCVQVWQSDPALQGCRILCLDYTHNRRGIYAVVALVFMIGVMILGIFICNVVKSGAAGWLHFKRPLLLVCSSDQSAHVSAVCALASILQEELGVTVHTSLWAQSSQTHTGTSVADLGPLPWLYGQWEAVSKAQGKVLIIWSPEAKKTFEKWKVETTSASKNEKKTDNQRKAGERLEKAAVVERGDWKSSRKIQWKLKREKAADDFNDQRPQREPSTVIQPVFMASLVCLNGALQKCKGQRTAIVYFHGLGHSRDIPKAFREVPRYCLPQNFRGLIQELGEVKTHAEPSEIGWHCWPRLLSKVLTVYLARQLARRLQEVLPWSGGTSVSSSVKKTSDQTAGRLRLLLAAGPDAAPEQEPLQGSPQEL